MALRNRFSKLTNSVTILFLTPIKSFTLFLMPFALVVFPFIDIKLSERTIVLHIDKTGADYMRKLLKAAHKRLVTFVGVVDDKHTDSFHTFFSISWSTETAVIV